MARELILRLEEHANRTLLVDAGGQRKWTGAEMLDCAGKIATSLIGRLGLKPGQVVFMMCDHTDYEILFALGVLLAGGSLYGSHPQDGLAEQRTLCQLVKPDLFATSGGLYQMVVDLKAGSPELAQARCVVVDGGLVDLNGNGCNQVDSNNNNNNIDVHSLSSLDGGSPAVLLGELLAGEHDRQLVRRVAFELLASGHHVATYMLTSGSTGRPKVVPTTHREIMCSLYSMISAMKYPVGSAEGEGEHVSAERGVVLPITRDSIIAGDLPLDHGAGVNTIFLSLIAGSKYVVLPSYEVDSFWQGVHDYRITHSISSTTFVYKLLSRLENLIDSGKTNRWDLSSFEYVACAGSKLVYTDLVAKIRDTYRSLRVVQCYGATEVGFISLLCPEESSSHIRSVGYLFPGLIGKVVDPDSGKLCGPLEKGELHLWSESKFKNYKCHPADDPAKLFEDCHDEQGFYRVGDQVYYDEEGRLYIQGRYKETLFLMQDWKILPAELEEVVDQHPLVEQSVVVGTPDKSLPGCHSPRAYVKLVAANSNKLAALKDDRLREALEKDCRQLIASDIYKFVAERTAEAKHLTGGVRILDDFPRVGLLGKIDRKTLRALE